MAQTFTLTLETYEALVAFARAGAQTPDRARALDHFLAQIERASGVTRYKLWVQWQEADQPLPPSTRFPTVWPPELRFYIELLTRPIGRQDVEAVLRTKARRPVTVMVTPDPGAVLGWTKLDDYFLQ